MEVQHQESPIYGDLLEVILAHVPLVDLANVYKVSKSWEYAVWSSLLHLNVVKPWLIIHTQCSRSLAQYPIQAYDPRSNLWVEIKQQTPAPATKFTTSFIRTTYSNLFYDICGKQLSFSIDPLHLTWVHVAPPKVWRVDPIMAKVGHHIVVAGGASELLDDDPLSVEMYDVETSQWSMCQSMPDMFKQSASSTWLSVAANQSKMFVTQKATGVTYSFNPQTKTWSGPYDLRPDPRVFFTTIGFASEDSLIVLGILGHSQRVDTLKIWKINTEKMEFNQIGEIPSNLLGILKGDGTILSSISLTTADNFIYLYNNSDPQEIIYCELNNEELKWKNVKNLAWNDDVRIGCKIEMSCARVGISDLHMATAHGNCKFYVK